MVQGQVQIAAAGGIDDDDNPIGTDPMKVMAAIESVYSDDGVVVLMDLGSALMSAEMALEFVDPAWQPNIYLTEAPIVEGALAAAVQAMVGGSAESVLAEARAALLAKQALLAPVLGDLPDDAPAAAAPADAHDALALTLVVPNRLGLHARPAAKLVGLAHQFSADIRVSKAGKSVNAKSINQVATLGAHQGDELTFNASGSDAADALEAIRALAEDNFGDRDDDGPLSAPAVSAPLVATSRSDSRIDAIPASEGVAIGPTFVYAPVLPPIEEHAVADPTAEWNRLHRAIDEAQAELREIAHQTKLRSGSAESGIFDAHRLILEDPELHDAVKAQLAERSVNAEAIWHDIMEATAEQYSRLSDAYMQARSADVRDAANRVLRRLLNLRPPKLNLAEPAILVARELTPSDTAQLKPDTILGIITESGGATGHSAILARALGIPAVVGAGLFLDRLASGQTIALDGSSGRIWLAPTDADIIALREQQAAWVAEREAARSAGQGPAVTRDGVSLEIAANIGSPNDAAVAVTYGAEAVGLFRTEFLYFDRTEAPSEQEQFDAYVAAAAALDGRPLIVRTLDVGGDKAVSYIDIGKEDNPFLGWRAIRYCLDHTDLFMIQLRAICRAAALYDIRIMFPMIGTYAELHRAKALLALAMMELERENVAVNREMQVGIMIEVPSAVFSAEKLAESVDFFSIGTNDLTQYLMAADRGNAKVANLVSALQPAVLNAVKQTVSAAHKVGIWVGMCGELAGNPLATPVLVGLGLDELSMSAPSIPAVKRVIRTLDSAEARAVAEHVLTLDSANAVLRYLEQQSERRARS
jgi:phosphocarrier protein FPr